MKQHIICVFCLLFGWQMQAQQSHIPPSDTPKDADVEAYLTYAGSQAVVYTGREEPKYPTYVLNHPYFETHEYRDGLLSFEGLVYPNVKLRLNQETEELILLSPDGRFNVIVPAERVDYAYIGPYYISYYREDDGVLPKGCYVWLHNGKYPVLRRETVFLSSNTNEMQLEYSFTKRIRFYIYKDGVYKQVKSKGSVLKLFKSKKKELKALIKEHGLNFNSEPDKAITAVVKLYEYLEQ